jgi:hypothetical protein
VDLADRVDLNRKPVDLSRKPQLSGRTKINNQDADGEAIGTPGKTHAPHTRITGQAIAQPVLHEAGERQLIAHR